MRSTDQRVLIVDDDVMVADTLRMVFAKNGYDSRTSYSANEGLLCAREFRPNLLLCDVHMPGRDGLSLVAEVMRELPDCRILLLTGFYANLGAIEQHSRNLARPVGILTKPCMPVELLREVSHMLSIT